MRAKTYLTLMDLSEEDFNEITTLILKGEHDVARKRLNESIEVRVDVAALRDSVT